MVSSISYKNIWKVALPIIISGVAQNIVAVTDTAFLGRVGEIELGAAGNASLFYFVLVLTGMGITTGSQIIIGRRNGEQNFGQIGQLFNHTLYLMLGVGVFIVGLCYMYSGDLLTLITKSNDIYNASVAYLDYRIYGILFAFINLTFVALYVGTTRTKILIYTTLIMSATNIILDYGLIFGNLHMPQMGISGAALASVLAEISSLIFFIIYASTNTSLKKYGLFRFQAPDKKRIQQILKIGGPVMIQGFISVGAWFLFFIMIEKIGERELAVSHIIRSIYMVLMIPLFGFSAATNTLVSNLIGAGNQKSVGLLIKRILLLCLLSTAVLLQLIIFIPEFIVGIYTQQPDLIAETLSTLKVISVIMFFFCISFILFHGVNGTGNTRVSLIIETITIVIYLLTIYYVIFCVKASLPTIWATELVYYMVLGTLSFIYLKRGSWKKTSL